MPSRNPVAMSDLSPDVQARVRERTGQAPKLGPNSPLLQVKAKRVAKADLEFPVQSEIVAWADDAETQAVHPELDSLYAIPNFFGLSGSKGSRIHAAQRAVAEGRKKGMPDLCLPVPRGGYGALYLEVKHETGAVGKAQVRRIARLRQLGNRVEVCLSVDTAKAIILQYLTSQEN